jgi:hypothetical protein
VAALFLAAKLEDSPKQMRDILAVFHYLENRGREPPVPFLEVGSTVRAVAHHSLFHDRSLSHAVARTHAQEYWRMKQELISTERSMLSKLGFHVAIDHPHKFILSYLRVLGSENDRYQRTRSLYHCMHTLTPARHTDHGRTQGVCPEGLEFPERQLADDGVRALHSRGGRHRRHLHGRSPPPHLAARVSSVVGTL